MDEQKRLNHNQVERNRKRKLNEHLSWIASMLPADSEIQERQTTVDIIQKAASFLESLKQKRTDLIKQKGEPQSFQQMEEMGSKLTALESEVGQMRTAIRDHGKKQETACSLWDRGHKRKTSPLCPVQANSAPDENNSRATSKYSSRRRTTVALLLENKKQSLQDQQQQMLHQQQPQQQVAFPNPTMADLEGANIIERAWLSAELSCQVTSQNTGPQTGDSTITAPIPSTQTFLMGREVPTLVPVGSSPSMNNSRMLPPVPAAAQPYPVTHVLSNGQIWSVAGFMPGSLTPPTLQVLTPTASPSFETQPILTTLTGQGISVLPDQVRRCLQSQLPHQASTVASTLTSAVSTVPRPLPPNLNAPGASSIVKSVQTLALSSSIVSTLRNSTINSACSTVGSSMQRNLAVCPQKNLADCTQKNLAVCPQKNLAVCPQKNLAVCTQKNLAVCPQKNLAVCPQKNLAVCTQKNLAVCTQKNLAICPQKNLAVCPQKNLAVCPQKKNLAVCPQKNLAVCPQKNLAVCPQKNLADCTQKNLAVFPQKNLAVCPQKNLADCTQKNLAVCTQKNLAVCTQKNLADCPQKNLAVCPQKNLADCTQKNLADCPQKNLADCTQKNLAVCPQKNLAVCTSSAVVSNLRSKPTDSVCSTVDVSHGTKAAVSNSSLQSQAMDSLTSSTVGCVQKHTEVSVSRADISSHRNKPADSVPSVNLGNKSAGSSSSSSIINGFKGNLENKTAGSASSSSIMSDLRGNFGGNQTAVSAGAPVVSDFQNQSVDCSSSSADNSGLHNSAAVSSVSTLSSSLGGQTVNATSATDTLSTSATEVAPVEQVLVQAPVVTEDILITTLGQQTTSRQQTTPGQTDPMSSVMSGYRAILPKPASGAEGGNPVVPALSSLSSPYLPKRSRRPSAKASAGQQRSVSKKPARKNTLRQRQASTTKQQPQPGNKPGSTDQSTTPSLVPAEILGEPGIDPDLPAAPKDLQSLENTSGPRDSPREPPPLPPPPPSESVVLDPMSVSPCEATRKFLERSLEKGLLDPQQYNCLLKDLERSSSECLSSSSSSSLSSSSSSHSSSSLPSSLPAAAAPSDSMVTSTPVAQVIPDKTETDTLGPQTSAPSTKADHSDLFLSLTAANLPDESPPLRAEMIVTTSVTQPASISSPAGRSSSVTPCVTTPAQPTWQSIPHLGSPTPSSGMRPQSPWQSFPLLSSSATSSAAALSSLHSALPSLPHLAIPASGTSTVVSSSHSAGQILPHFSSPTISLPVPFSVGQSVSHTSTTTTTTTTTGPSTPPPPTPVVIGFSPINSVHTVELPTISPEKLHKSVSLPSWWSGTNVTPKTTVSSSRLVEKATLKAGGDDKFRRPHPGIYSADNFVHSSQHNSRADSGHFQQQSTTSHVSAETRRAAATHDSSGFNFTSIGLNLTSADTASKSCAPAPPTFSLSLPVPTQPSISWSSTPYCQPSAPFPFLPSQTAHCMPMPGPPDPSLNMLMHDTGLNRDGSNIAKMGDPSATSSALSYPNVSFTAMLAGESSSGSMGDKTSFDSELTKMGSLMNKTSSDFSYCLSDPGPSRSGGSQKLLSEVPAPPQRLPQIPAQFGHTPMGSHQNVIQASCPSSTYFPSSGFPSSNLTTSPLHHPSVPPPLPDIDHLVNRGFDSLYNASPVSDGLSGGRFDPHGLGYPKDLHHTRPLEHVSALSSSSRKTGSQQHSGEAKSGQILGESSIGDFGGLLPPGQSHHPLIAPHNTPTPPSSSSTLNYPPTTSPSERATTRKRKYSSSAKKKITYTTDPDTNFTQNIFNSSQGYPSLFNFQNPMMQAEKTTTQSDGQFLGNSLFTNTPQPLSSSEKKTADLGPTYPMFPPPPPPSHPQNGIGINFQPGFGMGSNHTGGPVTSVSVTPHVNNFSLGNIFSDVAGGSGGDSTIKFPNHANSILHPPAPPPPPPPPPPPQASMDPGGIQHHQHQGSSLYHNHSHHHHRNSHLLSSAMTIPSFLGHSRSFDATATWR